MKRVKISRYVYNFELANFTGLRNTLLHTPFDIGLNNINGIDQCWQNWRDLFLTTVDMLIPKFKISDAKSPKWIDGEVISLSKRKDKLWRIAKRSKSPVHWDNYKAIRKQLKTLTKCKYRKFLVSLQGELKDNPRQFWSFYRSMTKTARITKTMGLGREKASSSYGEATLFNKFFVSVFQRPNSQAAIFDETLT